jgi:hypothetical protein
MSESQSVRRWEYKTELFPLGRGWGGVGGLKFDSDAFDATLNRFDSEGWELLSSSTVNVDGTTNLIVAIFKRPRI